MKKTIITLIFLIVPLILLNAQTIYRKSMADANLSINPACPSWQTNNNGSANYMQASTWTWSGVGCGQGNVRGIVQFDLNISADPHRLYDNRAAMLLFFPPGSLEVHQYLGGATDNQFYIQRVTAAWGELTVTWDNQPASTTVGQVLVPSCNPNPSTQDDTIDVSALVYDWICNSVPNYGVKIVLVNEGTTYRRTTFATREHADTTKCPKLALEYAQIAASAPDSVCQGNPFTISCALTNAFNPGLYQFQWTHLNSSTTYNTQNVANPAYVNGWNTYVVNVTNPWCQSAADTVVVYIGQLSGASASSNSPVWVGDSLYLYASGGTFYQWSGPNGFSSSLQNPVIPNISVADSGIYMVIVSNSMGCSDTAYVTVLVCDSPTATAGSNSPVCVGQTLNLWSGGGFSYNWTGPNGFNSIQQSPSISPAGPSASGTYTVTVTNVNGCSSSTTVTVTVNPNPVVTVTPNPLVICAGDQDTLTASGAASYTWSPTTGLNTGTGAVVIANPGFTSVYTVTGTSNGCTGSTSVTVTVNAAIIADAGNPVSVCAGNSTQLNASGGTIYSWTPVTGLNNPNIANPTATPAATITYTVMVSNGSCTPATDMVTVTVVPNPTAVITGDTLVCAGTLAVLTASGGTSYFWSNSANTASINVYPTAPTIYTVTVTSLGCTDAASISVDVFNSISVDAGDDTTITLGSTCQLNVTGGVNWSWSPAYGLSCTDCQNPLASPTETTTYTVTAEDSNGCQGVDYVTIIVAIECGAVYIPNAFSPNGDNYNDMLYVRGNCIESMAFIIYDRWGDKVFSSSATSDGWDGTLRNKPLDSGVFYYNLKATLMDGSEIKRKGSITIIK
jgi:gliding motility-associated-like protein